MKKLLMLIFLAIFVTSCQKEENEQKNTDDTIVTIVNDETNNNFVDGEVVTDDYTVYQRTLFANQWTGYLGGFEQSIPKPENPEVYFYENFEIYYENFDGDWIKINGIFSDMYYYWSYSNTTHFLVFNWHSTPAPQQNIKVKILLVNPQ